MVRSMVKPLVAGRTWEGPGSGKVQDLEGSVGGSGIWEPRSGDSGPQGSRGQGARGAKNPWGQARVAKGIYAARSGGLETGAEKADQQIWRIKKDWTT